MKKSVKIALTAAAVGTAAVFGVAEIAYESILNMKFAKKVTGKLGLEDENMMSIYLRHPVFTESYKWFEEHSPSDTVIISEKGENVHGYIIKNPADTGKWAVCVHGYSGDPKAESPFAKHLYDQGYSILLPHLRAHEKDTHRYCSMGYHDKDIVLAWINYLVSTYPECEILLHGVSMGSATVMLVTGEKLPENVKCAVADCGYSSCWDEYAYEMKHAYHIPVFPVLHAMNAISVLRGNFDFKKCSPKDAVTRSETPTLFIHGTADDFVPYSMLDVVYDACASEKDRLDIPDAVHATAVAADPEGYFGKMDEFTRKYINIL